VYTLTRPRFFIRRRLLGWVTDIALSSYLPY
jgi:hypothetical protein